MTAAIEAPRSTTRIVFVDDDQELGEYLKQDFISSGFAFRYVGSPWDEGLSESFDAESSYVLDLDLGPGHSCDGFDALKELKKKWPTAFVCIYSSHLEEHPEYVRRAHRLGADLILSKSSNRKEDVKSMVRAIESSRGASGLEDFPVPPPRRSGRISVNLTFKGKSIPIPEENPWSDL